MKWLQNSLPFWLRREVKADWRELRSIAFLVFLMWLGFSADQIVV